MRTQNKRFSAACKAQRQQNLQYKKTKLYLIQVGMILITHLDCKNRVKKKTQKKAENLMQTKMSASHWET